MDLVLIESKPPVNSQQFTVDPNKCILQQFNKQSNFNRNKQPFYNKNKPSNSNE